MVNPFALLGLPESFDLDAADLHRRFIAAAAAAHPDRHIDPLDQADAAERAAAINAAYRTLADPELRAQALLELWGGIDSRTSGKQDSTKSEKSGSGVLPASVLALMMEKREELDRAAAAGDRAALLRLRQWAEQERHDHLTRIGELFRQAAASDPAERAPLLKAIRLELNGLRYIQRMIEQAPG